MAIITWPGTIIPGPGSGFGQRRYDLTFASEATGAQQDRLLGPPRWSLNIVQPEALGQRQAGRWQAVIMSLRGKVNHLLCPNFGRLQPMGTMRGTLTLNAAPSAGAVAISVTGGAGQAGKTLQAGDYLQIGSGLGTSQVVMVMADATANGSGVIALTTEPPLRTAFASGTAVQWDRPAAYFKQQGTAVAWSYEPGREIVTTGMAVDLLEVWQ
jgi:hypothetical protein